MPDSEELLARVDAALRDFLDRECRALAGLAGELGPVAASAREFVLAGGKRLRPLFCYWGHRAAGGADSDAVVAAAASLELVQACALAHDDVIDASDTRRGRPSLHREWQRRHREAAWDGDSERFGMAAGVLLGDLFLAWSDAMLAGSGLTAAETARARPVWDLMRTEVMAGQFLDVVEQARADSSVERSLRVAALKSGRYSVERPLLLGAAIAGAPEPLATALAAFGVDVGVAFQLRDDLLGVFGDPERTGKPAGDDLREGKRTVLVAAALQAGTPAQRRLLQEALGDPALTQDGVEAVRRVLVDTGAARTVEAMIRERADRALAVLDEASLAGEARDALRDLVEAALHRVH